MTITLFFGDYTKRNTTILTTNHITMVSLGNHLIQNFSPLDAPYLLCFILDYRRRNHIQKLRHDASI